MKTVSLKDATHAQLLRYASINLNLPGVQPNTGEEKLRERIKAATGEDCIYVQTSIKEEDAPGKKPRNPVVGQAASRNRHQVVMDPMRFAYRDPRFLINIAAERGKGGKAHVPVSVNGTCILLPRGQDIEVPARYFFALKAAVATVIEDIFDDNNQPVRQQSEVPQYQYSIVRSPSQDEIDDWEDFINAHERSSEKKRRLHLKNERELAA